MSLSPSLWNRVRRLESTAIGRFDLVAALDAWWHCDPRAPQQIAADDASALRSLGRPDAAPGSPAAELQELERAWARVLQMESR